MSVALPWGRDSARIAANDAPRTERIAAVDLFRDFAAAEPAWHRLKSEGALATPYQSYDFLASWYWHVGRVKGVTPLLVAAYDFAGRPVLLWPLGYADCGPLRILQFLGGKHANTNFGLWQREFAASATAEDIRLVLDRIASSEYGIDLAALHRQPHAWDGVANPMRLLPHQPSPNDFCRRDLCRSTGEGADWPVSRSRRKQLRSKSRRLAALPGYRYFRAATPDENERLLNWFFPVKATHLAAHGLSSVYAEPGIEDFVRDICHHGLARGAPLMELHAIEGDGELLALFGGTGDGRRFSSMFNTYTLGPYARYSPGLVLLTQMIAELSKRGFTSLDLGAGDADYKRGFCRETEPLFESFVPMTVLGYFAAVGARSATTLKRAIKNAPRLWSALQATRRHMFAPRR